MIWLIALVAFILFWLLRALFYHLKANKISSLWKTYKDFIQHKPNSLIRNKALIIDLFREAKVPDFTIPQYEVINPSRGLRHELSGFDHIHINRHDVNSIFHMKFDEAQGVFEQKKRDSFNPFTWVLTLIFLPKNIIQYIAPNSNASAGWIQLLQVLYWISMVLIGLHNARIINLLYWFS